MEGIHAMTAPELVKTEASHNPATSEVYTDQGPKNPSCSEVDRR